MRRLDKDEILALEKFLVEDSDEVIGIEIYKGLSASSSGSSEPKEIIKYAIADLAGGDLITLDECRTLCAVVGNQLYYRDIYGNARALEAETNFQYFSKADRSYYAEIIKVLYAGSATKLPDEEILSLKAILVKDNKQIVGVRIAYGYMGVGGSNRSGFQETHCYEYTIEQLDGMEPFRVMNSQICALVNDTLYLRYKDDNEMKVYTINSTGRTMTGDSVAYDTVAAVRISLLLKED